MGFARSVRILRNKYCPHLEPYRGCADHRYSDTYTYFGPSDAHFYIDADLGGEAVGYRHSRFTSNYSDNDFGWESDPITR